jgi:hypothetical protein
MSRAAYLEKRDRLARDLRLLSVVLTCLLALQLARGAVSAAMFWSLFSGGGAGGRPGLEVLFPGAAGWWEALSLILGLMAAAGFCLWLAQAYRLFKWRDDVRTAYTPLEAVVYLFVPFANWWLTLTIFRELWRGTDPREKDPNQARARLVVCWWAAWVPLSLLGARLVGRFVSEEAGRAAEPWLIALTEAWLALAAGLSLALVLGLTRRLTRFGPRPSAWPTVDQAAAELERSVWRTKTTISSRPFGGRPRLIG